MELKYTWAATAGNVTATSNRTIMELKWGLWEVQLMKMFFFQSHHHGIEIHLYELFCR